MSNREIQEKVRYELLCVCVFVCVRVFKEQGHTCIHAGLCNWLRSLDGGV